MNMNRLPQMPRYFSAYPVSWCLPLVRRVISPRVRFMYIIMTPIIISHKSPIRKPDFANTYGSPRIPAPMIVPVRVKAVAQNFLLNLIVLLVVLFL